MFLFQPAMNDLCFDKVINVFFAPILMACCSSIVEGWGELWHTKDFDTESFINSRVYFNKYLIKKWTISVGLSRKFLLSCWYIL